MCDQKFKNVSPLMNELIDKAKNIFKFNGEIAKQLFLYDAFDLNQKVDISVERMYFSEVIKHVPKTFTIKLFDEHQSSSDFSVIDFKTLTHANVYDGDTMVLTIIVYDTEGDDWMFRLNNDIRLPAKHIYFHSIKWDVDYVKPEIVLMYELLDPIDYHQLPNYKNVIEALSYYQFVMLRLVVGDDRINQALISERKAI
ncbi:MULTISPECIES: hypothetical protein [Staphylococcus]|uniref:Uncharacterized protein n=4 Tax=Staphylococcus TaxID=1279 RepID=A0A380CI64_9STAP|nr:hypothetical protein [Staphylococcus arlettae]EJY94723.1 hypothetical protein SARL_11881 [Staphylococcus arlettae CVD059]ERF49977.1 hypothetical protein N039_00830 [Staphylococcus sp. EGD-HP3]MDT4050639.1 hypothetical protein [Staphylococcus arlettae]SUJ20053.1 Uncharacterised protein [Staphylococcus arlettae]BBK28333.1 hypothetical protein SAP2_15170 [Staphylococcus arlettae]